MFFLIEGYTPLHTPFAPRSFTKLAYRGNDNTSIDNEYCHLGTRWPLGRIWDVRWVVVGWSEWSSWWFQIPHGQSTWHSPQKVGEYRANINRYMVTVPSTFTLVYMLCSPLFLGKVPTLTEHNFQMGWNPPTTGSFFGQAGFMPLNQCKLSRFVDVQFDGEWFGFTRLLVTIAAVGWKVGRFPNKWLRE